MKLCNYRKPMKESKPNDYEPWKWFWMMEWCRINGLAPARQEVWALAETKWNEMRAWDSKLHES